MEKDVGRELDRSSLGYSGPHSQHKENMLVQRTKKAMRSRRKREANIVIPEISESNTQFRFKDKDKDFKLNLS